MMIVIDQEGNRNNILRVKDQPSKAETPHIDDKLVPKF